MNLAQLIDPEWAREGSRQRFELMRRQADEPAAPRTPVIQQPPESAPLTKPPRIRRTADTVLLQTLRAVSALTRPGGEGASLRAIAERVGRTIESISYSILPTVNGGYLLRTGERKHYRYTLTDKARLFLSANADD